VREREKEERERQKEERGRRERREIEKKERGSENRQRVDDVIMTKQVLRTSAVVLHRDRGEEVLEVDSRAHKERRREDVFEIRTRVVVRKGIVTR
jgi:hypothetical protein